MLCIRLRGKACSLETQSIRVAVALSVAMAFLVGCHAGASDVPRSVAPLADGPQLAAFASRQSADLTALETGKLEFVRGCFELGGPTIWPYGFRVATNERSIISPDGRVFRLGDRLSLGGGFVPVAAIRVGLINRDCLHGVSMAWATGNVTALSTR